MPLPLTMLVGGVVGGVAGFACYAGRVILSGEPWSWRDAAAATAGGLVGGALFPVALVGLAAVGVPAAGAYVLAGGVAWGGLWTLAQDATAWALGRRRGLGPPSRYVAATATGLLLSALLLPVAARVIAPGGRLVAHEGTVAAFTEPARPVAANLLKAEAEFLAYGAGSAGLDALTPARSPARAPSRLVDRPLGGDAPPRAAPVCEATRVEPAEGPASRPDATPPRRGMADVVRLAR